MLWQKKFKPFQMHPQQRVNHFPGMNLPRGEDHMGRGRGAAGDGWKPTGHGKKATDATRSFLAKAEPVRREPALQVYKETRDMYAEPSADFRKKNVRARCCCRRRPSRAR